MRNKSKVFTLLELLIVIAIIGILASMLLPALRTARESAKTIQCAGNMKQFGLAFRMYAGDYCDYMPANIGTNFWWPDLHEKEKYFNDPRIFICPSESNVCYIWAGFPKLGTNYRYNFRLGTTGYVEQGKLANVKYPTRATVLIDGNMLNYTPLYKYDLNVADFYASYDLYYNTALQQADQRHNGGLNILFVDGHVNKNKVKCDAITWTAVWRPE